MAEVLPPFYFYFFWLCEPTLAAVGAAYAGFRPRVYALDLVPDGVERFTSVLGDTIRGRMAIGALGSCFFVLAMISFSLFPIFKWHSPPALQERLIAGILLPLAIGDIIHIIATLVPLPQELRVQPWRWTQLIHGNITITIVLLAVRLAWFTGVGRFSPSRIPNSTVVESEIIVAEESASPALGEVAAPRRRGGRSRKSQAEKSE